jgi:prepilin-type N-terminal cleavage/methylation domain-containing protein
MGSSRSYPWYAPSPCLRLSRSRKAFTLFEMILVLALIVLLGAAVYPSVEAMYGDSKVTASGDMVRAAWAEAQSRAIDEGRAYRFSIRANTGNWKLAPDEGDSRTPDDNSGPNGTGKQSFEGILEKGVRFDAPESWGTRDTQPGESAVPQGATDSSSWTTAVVFLPDGTAKENRTVRLRARGIRPLELRVRGLTGVITVHTLEMNKP